MQQARPPNYRLLDKKNMRQIVTNAAYFQAMTKMKLQKASLVYITRMGTLTVVTLDLAACGVVTRKALLTPLAKSTHSISYNAERYVVNMQLRIQVLEDLGVATGQEAGLPIPLESRPPSGAPAAAPIPPEDEGPTSPRRRGQGAGRHPRAIVGALYEADGAGAAAAVGVSDDGAPAPPQAQQETLGDRRDINASIGEGCEAMFDSLPASSKSKLRGRAEQLFQHLASSPTLFPPLRTADGQVVPTPPAQLAPADARPLLVQALIRTAQRDLNHAVARRFVRTRGELARAEVAEGVALGDFLASVAHHARRDLWKGEVVQWAEGHVHAMLETLQSELARFIEAAD